MTLAMFTMPEIPSTRTEMRYGLGFDNDIIIDLFEFFGDCFWCHCLQETSVTNEKPKP